jgi:hypothetical protein
VQSFKGVMICSAVNVVSCFCGGHHDQLSVRHADRLERGLCDLLCFLLFSLAAKSKERRAQKYEKDIGHTAVRCFADGSIWVRHNGDICGRG